MLTCLAGRLRDFNARALRRKYKDIFFSGFGTMLGRLPVADRVGRLALTLSGFDNWLVERYQVLMERGKQRTTQKGNEPFRVDF